MLYVPCTSDAQSVRCACGIVCEACTVRVLAAQRISRQAVYVPCTCRAHAANRPLRNMATGPPGPGRSPPVAVSIVRSRRSGLAALSPGPRPRLGIVLVSRSAAMSDPRCTDPGVSSSSATPHSERLGSSGVQRFILALGSYRYLFVPRLSASLFADTYLSSYAIVRLYFLVCFAHVDHSI